MAYTSIKPSDLFRAQLYTGNGSARSITYTESTNMQPGLIWIKGRNTTASWLSNDEVRGATKRLKLDLDSAESTETQMISSFNTNGFSLGTSTTANQNGTNFASYSWKGTGSTVTNNDGSIATTLSANQTAGFSVFTFTGTGSNATLGHGLNAVPEMYIIKRYDQSNNWRVYHKDLGNTHYLTLETNEQQQSSSGFANNTSPTSSVISVGNLGSANTNGGSMLCYAFAPKKGYSAFGGYTGNGNTNGPFIYTGFKPAFVIIKVKSGNNNHWFVFDKHRLGYNGANEYLKTDTTDTESSSTNRIDFLSNGFKCRTANDGVNGNSDTYVWWAIADEPLVSDVGNNGIPATAR